MVARRDVRLTMRSDSMWKASLNSDTECVMTAKTISTTKNKKRSAAKIPRFLAFLQRSCV